LARFEKKNFESRPFSNIVRSAHGRWTPCAFAGYAARRDYRLCEAVLQRPSGSRISARFLCMHFNQANAPGGLVWNGHRARIFAGTLA
jgi:hypothetical protein